MNALHKPPRKTLQKWHANKRAKERYGENIPEETRTEIKRRLRKWAKLQHHERRGEASRNARMEAIDNLGVIREEGPNNRGRIRARVTVEDRPYRVVYDTNTNEIVTFLPLEQEKRPEARIAGETVTA